MAASTPRDRGATATVPDSAVQSKSFYERDDDEDDREHDQEVDGRAENVEADPTDQPKNKQNDRNSPEHINLSPDRTPSVVREAGPVRRCLAIPVGKAAFSANVSLS